MQFDEDESQWYLQGSKSTAFNTIYDGIVGIGTSILGNQTGATFVTRRLDNRGLEDRLYKFRYVIPKNSLMQDHLLMVLFYKNLTQLVLDLHLI